MFNNITLVRRNNSGIELERMKVPILYGPKEKYITRLQSDPDLQRETQLTLPRMSFQLTGITYDPARKQNSLIKNVKANTASRIDSQYMGVPYNLNFQLSVYARNIDDGTHIIEQIVPYFNPDYTVTADLIPQVGITKDIPIILNSVESDVDYEGSFDTVRYVYWNLSFTMKGYFFGPVSSTGVIRKIDVNIYNDDRLRGGNIIRINTNQGNNGTYKIDDFVYQGPSYQTATAFGQVLNWNANTETLVIGGAQGTFTTNNKIRALSSNASYNLASFDSSPMKLTNIHIEPDPVNALPTDDYGYNITITEWPETE